MTRALLALLALAACHDVPPLPAPGSPDDLAVYLRTVVGGDELTRKREVGSWIVDEATWDKDIVEPYRALHADYVRTFDAGAAALVTRLAAPAEVTARRHFAGDPRLTRAQGRLRWAVPVQYPSAVAELAGQPLDTVFLYAGGHWRALVGLDDLMVARVRALDPACADRMQQAGPKNRCTEVSWNVADAALRADAPRFAHACQLAATLCGNPAP